VRLTRALPASGLAWLPALLAPGLCWLACSSSGPLGGMQPNRPVVSQQTFSAVAGSLKVVGVMPFYPQPELRQRLGSAVAAEEVAETVSGYFADALRGQGVRVIPPSDLALAFTNQGRATPRRDPRAAAEVAARQFGATAVVLGAVYRWREREGGARGATGPASAGFEVHLFDTRDGRRLFDARFDHTQRTLTGDPFMARKYPGGGSRFLTVAELARWGADGAASALVDGQWRLSK
jgi:hypothetical protein